MKLRQFITAVSAALTVQLSACTLLPGDMQEKVGGIMGGVFGGLAANKMAEHAPAALRPIITATGVLIGAELGKSLSKYLNEQDQKKLQQQVSVQIQNPQPQISVSCTGEQGTYRSMSMQKAMSMSCGSKENKVILSSDATTKIGKQECKSMKTEVMNEQGTLETVNTQNCKGSDGVWHEKIV